MDDKVNVLYDDPFSMFTNLIFESLVAITTSYGTNSEETTELIVALF
jgi:hypothetical protein